MTGGVCVWKRDRGRHTVKWMRSNPRMETKNTSVQVRRVKEDTSWHLMPGNKITLIFFYASRYCHFSILLMRIIKFSSQTLAAIPLNTEHHKGMMTSKQAGHAKWNQILNLFYTCWSSVPRTGTSLSSHMNIHWTSTVRAHKQTNVQMDAKDVRNSQTQNNRIQKMAGCHGNLLGCVCGVGVGRYGGIPHRSL